MSSDLQLRAWKVMSTWRITLAREQTSAEGESSYPNFKRPAVNRRRLHPEALTEDYE